MKPILKKQYLNRLNYIEGHLKGIQKMIEKNHYCIDVIQQNQAVVSAIEKLNQMILDNHLSSCVTKAIKGKGEKERRQKIKEILEVFRAKR